MMKTKKYLLIVALSCIGAAVSAQNYNYEEMLRQHPEMICGCDYLCPTGEVKLTAAPKGYEVFYISHYGRHGARYAWQDDLYTTIKQVLYKADSLDNLTPMGKEYLAKFKKLYPEIEHDYGLLSRKGWEQQKALGARMYSNFPQVFPAGAQVNARTSPSGRCVMSMSAFCLGLQAGSPEAVITEQVGPRHLHAIIPQSSGNPYRVVPEPEKLLFDETWMEYIERTADYRGVLDRVFKDRNVSLPEDKQWNFCYYLNFFWHGMQSLDTDLDFSEIFTAKDKLDFWKIDCFQFYTHAWPGRKGYLPVVKDIIERADSRIASGGKGADLRFGHDSSFLPLIMLLGVNGYDHECVNGDETPVWCEMNDVPMAANIQLVFYRPRKSGDILFKILLNGVEARLPLETDKWPYYKWDDFKGRFPGLASSSL